MSLGSRLRKVRLEKGMSQSDLASAAGVHYTQIGRYERKGATPAADILAKMANALEVSSDYLMNGSSDELASSELIDKELLNHFKEAQKLPEHDKKVIKALIDAFITKSQVRELVK